MDEIATIRKLLTEIKPLLEEKPEPDSNAATAITAARDRLVLVRLDLERVAANLRQWMPGPSETK